MNEKVGAIPSPRPAELAELEHCLYRLREVERVQGVVGFRLEQQLSTSHVLIMSVGGSGTMMIGESTWRLRGDAAYFCPPGQTFGVSPDAGQALHLHLLRFDVFEEMRRSRNRYRCIRENGRFPLHGELLLYTPDALLTLFESAETLHRSADKLDRFHAQSVLLELLYGIGKLSSRRQEDTRSGLERAKRFLEANYTEPLSLEQLARIAEISPKYFGELYKKKYGTSVGDDWTELRINKAKQLMAGGNSKLREIAHQVGYVDEFYFSRKFKKEVGVAPSAYMSRRSRKIAVDRAALIGHLLPLHRLPHAAPLHPKWGGYYYERYRHDIPVHLSALMNGRDRSDNVRTLLQTAPDLIVSSEKLNEVERRQLESVAPVFYMQEEQDCREQLRGLAGYLGETEEAEKWLRSYERLVEHTSERIRRQVTGERWLTLRVLKGTVYASCNRNMADVLYGDLQLSSAWAVPGLGQAAVYDEPLTPDRLAELAPDRLLVLVCQETETIAFWRSYQQSLEWRMLQAVRQNKAHAIPSDPWREYSPMAQWRIVEGLATLLSGDRP
ncbi:AraC family transcriptional regulator [Paenibacillus koleovorans]|uniref:AraC family transcriptional regulator n=1 Tax=Paenibacillus koleovorans TaxID=121608 RepID=UPI000FDB38EB|nr:AraC family transcriptional regulator [Paenibacillus koleovorans]